MEPRFEEVYRRLVSPHAREETSRTSDLDTLMQQQGSFCVYSLPRNGITTLLKKFVLLKNGVYVDGQYGEALQEVLAAEQEGREPLALDETVCLVDRVGEERGLELLERLGKSRQVVLRLHPHNGSYKGDFSARGFPMVEVGKILYAELKKEMDGEFSNTGLAFPEGFIRFAHDSYDRLGRMNWYIATALRMMVEENKIGVSEEEVKSRVEDKQPHLFRN